MEILNESVKLLVEEREVVEIRDLTAFFEDLKKDEKAVVKKLYLSEPH